ncbi:tetratricopeptide repeat protein [Actinoplanes flavus]|uniref:tetratricopeptide repeat protein n=1 Tax=Actinoplanes flavus TaxID=2820290 RepID=UPI0027DDD59A|nr:tetratricopeptide repeat protein [Actinoplanes flavus]
MSHTLPVYLPPALTDVDREREAVSIGVGAPARHLPLYRRSMENGARLLVEPPQK